MKFISLMVLITLGLSAWIYAQEKTFGLQPSDTTQARNERKKVVLISWDGLRPEFYLDNRFHTPTLRKIASQGVRVQAVEGVFPSLTYPSHTSLVTGVTPREHGVLSNNMFNWQEGPITPWYLDAAHIQVPTLWQQATQEGLKVAVIRWPATRGAQVTWPLPEVFSIKGYDQDTDLQLYEKATPQWLRRELEEKADLPAPFDDTPQIGFVRIDDWVTKASSYLLKAYGPDLMLIHLTEVDHAQHGTGTDSPETIAAVGAMDKQVDTILQNTNLNDTCFIVTGDHGHMNYSKRVRPNTLFATQGWITLDKDNTRDWTVIAHAGGGQAAIYVKDKTLLPQVHSLLKKNQSNLYSILDKQDLKKWGAYPDADFAIDGMDGIAMSGEAKGPLVSENNKAQSTHGWLPIHRQMDTGLVTMGCGLQPGQVFQKISNLNIAPTVAKMLDIKLPHAKSAPLHLKFKKPF